MADLYNDSTKEYLEYEITLTTKDMQIIKKNNARSSFSYASFNLCTNGKKVGKDENTDYCFVCNSSGKECESSFVDSCRIYIFFLSFANYNESPSIQ